MNRQELERLVRVEVRLGSLEPKVDEIRTDVKALLAAHNSQRGAAKLLALLWAGLLSLGGLLGGMFLGRSHG